MTKIKSSVNEFYHTNNKTVSRGEENGILEQTGALNLTAWVDQLTEDISDNLAMSRCTSGEKM